MNNQPKKIAKAKSAAVKTYTPYRRQNQRHSTRNIHRSTARSKPKNVTRKKRYPPDHTPLTVQAAARGLRAHLGLSQQAMATKLSLSMGALRNYESGAVPSPEARPLYAYLICAETQKRPQFASVFRAALYKVLGVPDEWGKAPRDVANIAAMRSFSKSSRGSIARNPWNDLDEALELFASPEIKQRLGLACRTTVEYLEEIQK